MKKIIALLLSLVLALSLTACGGKTTSASTPSSESSAAAQSSTPQTVSSEDETEPEESSFAAEETPEEPSSTAEEEPEDSSADEEEPPEEPISAVEEEPDTPPEEEPADASSEELIDGMRPEFKEAMDSYEAFYVDYCDFMKKYQEDPTNLELLMEYTEMLQKVDDMEAKLEAWDDEEEMNDAEWSYYLEVNSRVLAMLSEIEP